MLDALVVGAGPTGLLMTAELTRHGLRCRVVEQLEAPSPLSRAIVMQARTLEIFDALGLVQELYARGTPLVGFNMLGRGGRRAHVPLHAADWMETHHPRPLMIPQDATEAVLGAYVGSLGVEVERGRTLEDFQQDAQGVEARVRRADGSLETVRARWLLGCDGARSRVRKGAGLPFEGETYEDTCLLADVRMEWPLGHGEQFVIPSALGVMAIFPMPGEQRYRVILILPKDVPLPGGAQDDAAPLPLEQLQELVDRMAPVPVRLSEPRWLSRYRLHRRGVPRYRQGRVFLAGDSAHIHSPAGGQGMNTGLQDAHNLAWKLALVTKGRAPEALLDTYDEERHRVGQKLLEGTDRLFAVMARGGLLARLWRVYLAPRVAPKVLGSPLGQRRFMRFISQLFIHYRDSPLSTESLWGEDVGGLRMEDGPRPGERVPEVPVRAPGVERLHEALRGPPHTLLLFVGRVPEQTPAQLEALARGLEARWGPELLKARVVVEGEGKAGPSTLEDPRGEAHRRFGAGAPCLYLVRPDGYVGHRARPIDAKRLEAELTSRLGAASALAAVATVP